MMQVESEKDEEIRAYKIAQAERGQKELEMKLTQEQKAALEALESMDDFARMADVVPTGPYSVLKKFIKNTALPMDDVVRAWVSVDERLPDNGTYLCIGHGGTRFICLMRNGEWLRQSAAKRVVGITKWMPLP